MLSIPDRKPVRSLASAAIALAALLTCGAALAAHDMTTTFSGPKANTGTAMFYVEGGKRMLKVSPDFTVPDTPDPHWRVVDSKGTIYLLDRFPLKGDRVMRMVELPPYVKDVVKVQVWCAFAEVVLGEASFDHAVK